MTVHHPSAFPNLDPAYIFKVKLVILLWDVVLTFQLNIGQGHQIGKTPATQHTFVLVKGGSIFRGTTNLPHISSDQLRHDVSETSKFVDLALQSEQGFGASPRETDSFAICRNSSRALEMA